MLKFLLVGRRDVRPYAGFFALVFMICGFVPPCRRLMPRQAYHKDFSNGTDGTALLFNYLC